MKEGGMAYAQAQSVLEASGPSIDCTDLSGCSADQHSGDLV